MMLLGIDPMALYIPCPSHTPATLCSVFTMAGTLHLHLNSFHSPGKPQLVIYPLVTLWLLGSQGRCYLFHKTLQLCEISLPWPLLSFPVVFVVLISIRSFRKRFCLICFPLQLRGPYSQSHAVNTAFQSFETRAKLFASLQVSYLLHVSVISCHFHAFSSLPFSSFHGFQS